MSVHETRILPHWKDVARVIPEDFRYDGASSPFRRFYPIVYWSAYTRADIYTASRVHDFGYGPARLLGSPQVAMGEDMHSLFVLTRSDWDEIYRRALLSLGHPRVAAMHHAVLSYVGGMAWRKNDKRMIEQGVNTYANWLASRRASS